jgi:hypothetical protein
VYARRSIGRSSDPRAPHQREGVLGSLNMTADSFRLLPKKEETTSTWTATKWAETRKGWVFITSRPTLREALRPLISLWIDLLVLRLLNEPDPGQKAVCFVIDELASLQRLPQLHTAITENRKSQNPVVLGFQGRSQVEARYGDDTEAMLFVDESSLASTRQMRDFLARLGPNDRVLLIGDTRQHQGVEAGRPFEQLQQAGMRTAKLDQIVRQKDPAIKSAVKLLARGRSAAALIELRQQGRIQEISDRQERIRTVARMYAAAPENTLIVPPDNASRRELNLAVREELRTNDKLGDDDYSFRVLIQRQDMTGADRARGLSDRPLSAVQVHSISRGHSLGRSKPWTRGAGCCSFSRDRTRHLRNFRCKPSSCAYHRPKNRPAPSRTA